jgi:hypothetical protein
VEKNGHQFGFSYHRRGELGGMPFSRRSCLVFAVRFFCDLIQRAHTLEPWRWLSMGVRHFLQEKVKTTELKSSKDNRQTSFEAKPSRLFEFHKDPKRL